MGETTLVCSFTRWHRGEVAVAAADAVAAAVAAAAAWRLAVAAAVSALFDAGLVEAADGVEE